MPNRYWIGNTGTWTQTAHWSASSGGVGGASVPTLNDDVYFDVNSFTVGGVIEIYGTGNVRNMDWSGVLFSPTFRYNVLNIYGYLDTGAVGGFYGSSGGMGGTLYFLSTSALTPVTTHGKNLAYTVAFGGSGGWVLQDSLTSINYISLSRGTLNTNNQIVTTSRFQISGTLTKVLTMGSSIFSLSTEFYILSGTTNLTINAGTSTINTPSFWNNSILIGLTFYNVNITASSCNFLYPTGTNYLFLDGCDTFHNLNITQTSVGTTTMSCMLAVRLKSNKTITGTLTLAGFSASRRILVYSNIEGTQRTITANAVSLSNVDFLDIVGAGVASPFTGTSVGNCGNNSGITGTPATTRYWVGNGGSWSNAAHWSASSGGAGGATLPLPQDIVRFDNQSFNTGSQTVVSDIPILGGNIDWTGVTNSPAWQPFLDDGASSTSYRWLFIFGNLTLDSGMTVTGQAYDVFTFLTFNGRGNFTITSNGVSLLGTNNLYSLYNYIMINVAGGNSVSLSDDFAAAELQTRSGTFDANDHNVDLIGLFLGFDIEGGYGGISVLNMGSGNWIFNNKNTTGGGISWYTFAYTGLTTVNAETSTIMVNTDHKDYVTSSASFGFGSEPRPTPAYVPVEYTPVFNNLILYGSNNGTGYYPVFCGYTALNMTVNNLTILDPALRLSFSNQKTFTVTNTLSAVGVSGRLITFLTSTTFSNRRAYLSAGATLLAWVSVSYNTALGAAIPFDASNNCTNGGNNVNWSFVPVGITTGQVSWF